MYMGMYLLLERGQSVLEHLHCSRVVGPGKESKGEVCRSGGEASTHQLDGVCVCVNVHAGREAGREAG